LTLDGQEAQMQEVRLPARSPSELGAVVPLERLRSLLEDVAPVMREGLAGHSVVNINSTATGGGVAEMLQVLLPFTRGAGVDARWLVIEGDPEFFAITKRLHHRMHGRQGDDGSLGGAEHDHYDAVMRQNAELLAATVFPGDAVIVHDPQPAGLAAALKSWGLPVVWRCHIGVDEHNEFTAEAWSFLRPYLEPYVDAYVFTREQYAPSWVPRDRLHVIKPSIDPLAPKNQPMDDATVLHALAHVGLLEAPVVEPVTFLRQDGSPGRIRHYADITRTGPAPAADAPLVAQISRWDPLKDMLGVMHGFVDHVLDGTDAHLILAGPVVTAVADDPEAADVLEEVTQAWRDLPHAARSRVQLVCLPLVDVEENAAIVNALQRHADVVVQKSLAEGFGLTVAEAMYKGTPVVGSAVGGITDQIVDRVSGRLVADPRDLAEFGEAVRGLLDDPGEARRLGKAGHERVVENFLPDVHLRQWQQVLSQVIS
jgi:trehalose synthase